MKQNIIRLCAGPNSSLVHFVECKDKEGNTYIVADAGCISHSSVITKNSIPDAEVVGYGTIRTYKNTGKVWIEFSGYDTIGTRADHVRAVQIARTDVLNFVKEHWMADNQDCVLVAKKS